jgi:hypothetical protein
MKYNLTHIWLQELSVAVMIVCKNSAVKMNFIFKTKHNLSEKGVISHRVNLTKLYSYISTFPTNVIKRSNGHIL